MAESSPLLGLRPLCLLQPTPSQRPPDNVYPTCPVEPSTERGCPLFPIEDRQAQDREICTEEHRLRPWVQCPCLSLGLPSVQWVMSW